MVRELCESYWGLSPLDIEEMTLDQIYILAAKKDLLKTRGTVKGTPSSLASQGIIPPNESGMSYVQRLRAQRAAEKAAEERKSKRERRAKRRSELIEYKRQQGVD